MSDMDAGNGTTITIRITHSRLRVMFIAGFWLHVVLTFVPAYGARVGGFLGIGAQERSFSLLEVIRLAFANGKEGVGLLNVLWFCSMVAFAVLGMKQPQRWVFLGGACVTSFFLVLNFFSGSAAGVELYLLPHVLGFIASGMQLSGFWIKPLSSRAPGQEAQ
jgi:hypothetical protein